jgi:HAD superfamily hydrolase (TIGR01459 family)
MARRIDRLEQLTADYRAVLCDVWGVIHNGVRAFDDACAALAAARERGLAVILITNSPRPNDEVSVQLAALGVPRHCWDRMVTSGDVTRDLIAQGPRKVLHIGPDRDLGLYEGLDVELVEEFEASGAVCTGLVDDETEVPDDYIELLRRLRARNLPFICANPDIVVERGDRLVWCAGAIAREYGTLGGRTLIAGKPHHPIYDRALREAGALLGDDVSPAQALAIGDGVLTDVKGAAGAGIDVLYISAGIHAGEYGPSDDPDRERLLAFLEGHGYSPVATMPRLE